MSVYHIRDANSEDVSGMAKVRVDTWRAAYKGIVPDDFLESLSYQSITERWRVAFWEYRNPDVGIFVAESESRDIVGIAICGPQGNQDPFYRGGIFVLYVLPEYQNLGIGRRLVAACVQHLVQKLGFDTLLIWVLAENPYRKFYESLGGRPVREKTEEIGGRMLLEVGYGWEGIHLNLLPRLTANEPSCECLNEPLEFDHYAVLRYIGVDEINGRYGDAALWQCKICGRLWLHYLVEIEGFTGSGYYLMGLITPELSETITPDAAMDYINSLDWHLYGGSYFHGRKGRSTIKFT
jgi:ribosomal protein S18 acetylase RimI-like enzyme